MIEAQILSDDLMSNRSFYFRANDLQMQLIESFRKGKSPGETSHLKSLDEIFTIRPGFLYAFTGWPGSGKSEFLTQLAVMQSHFKDRRIALYSPESYPIDEFIDTIIHCYRGKSTDKRFPNCMSEEEYKDCIEWVNKYFFFCDWPETPDTTTILKSFEYLYEQEGARVFIVDPFNSLNAEGEDRNIALGLKRNLTAFKRFAAQKKVIVFLVEHPKTPNDTNEYNQVPGPRHMFGGTMWWNKVDVLATVHRPNREDKHDNSVVFKTWKIKKQELNGRPGEQTIYFDIRTKRYYENMHCIDHVMNVMTIEEIKQINDDQPF